MSCAHRAHAQATEPAHEPVEDLHDDEIYALVGRLPPGQAGLPEAIRQGDRWIEAPRGGPRRAGETVLAPRQGAGPAGPGSPPLARPPTFRPDRVASLHAQPGYDEAFRPRISPYKRGSALDTVALASDDRRTPVLGVGDVSLHTIPVESPDAPAPDERPRDRFWGEALLDLSAGPDVPVALPSVSPESRILGYRTEPPVALRFERDGADNHYVRPRAWVSEREVRLIWLTDAPRDYFAPSRIADVRADALAARAAPLPEPLRTQAARVAAEIGVRADTPLRTALDRLVAYFRSFVESDEPVPDTGDIYLDIVRSRRGVCRHRAWAFVITAAAVGIRSRFVMNEAHAWVEVELPETGWIRIDLGGSALGLRPTDSGDDAPSYRPALPDPFPRPASYLEELATAAEATAAARRSQGTGDGAAGVPGRSQPTAASDTTTSRTAHDASAPRSEESAAPQTPRPGQFTDADDGGRTPPERPPRRRVRVEVDGRRFEAHRGRRLEISGSVHMLDTDEPVEGVRVELWLQAPGRPRLLGVTVSRRGGLWYGAFTVPPDLPVGEYRLAVVVPGDAHTWPARAH
ncbi:MAG: transglutaminase-like domain-containing protein [Myxococcota bacterium]|nr:transglutaminase-like domain-containing protein [Myxococcota bacterium]